MNRIKADRLIKLINILLLISLLLAGCNDSEDSAITAASGKTYRIDSDLQDFYDSLGGKDVLGPGISKLSDVDSLKCQFTANARICFNPLMTGIQRFSLSPLGTSLNVGETPGDSSSDSNLIVNGFAIYNEFVSLYTQFSGTTYAGNPISQVHLNYEKQRIEQFFENIGFYRNFSDPPGTVKLLAYGAASCTKDCRYTSAREASLLSGSVPISGRSLLEDLQNVMDTEVFGKPLTQPYQSSDGNQEQVFESIVLFRDIYNGMVSARPITLQLGMPSTAPGAKLYGSEQGVVFYATSDGLGYHVPVLFDEFINEHGGTAISGDPIAELTEAQPGIYRQCFTNYCLEYSPEARKNHQITIMALGNQYLQLEQPQILLESTVESTPQTLSLQVNALHNPLSAEQTQQINIVVLNSTDQLPLTGIEADLVVTLPDGTMVSEIFPATLADGSSSLDLPNVKKVPNGSILAYQVCASITSEQTCQTGYYLVWTTP